MPTRLVRTDRIANIADFGAVPNLSTASGTNATAFASALAVSNQIAVPAGTWYFAEIIVGGNPWLPFGVEIFGQGVEGGTILRYLPTDDAIPAFSFFPGISRSVLRNFRLEGRVPTSLLVPNVGPVGIGISCDRSLFNRVRDVLLTDFNVGIQLNMGAPSTYAAHNVIERFEVHRCRTGLLARDGTNATVIENGRVFQSVIGYDAEGPGGAHEEGIGINVDGTLDPTFGPIGAQALLISGVTIEPAVVALRIAASRDVVVQSCYIEAGDPYSTGTPPSAWPYGRVRHRSFDIDDRCGEIVMIGNLVSEPNVPPGEENWTPTEIAIVPEARGAVDNSSAPTSGTVSYFTSGYGGGVSGATAALANRIRNSDMSRGTMFWSTSGDAIVTPNQSPFVIGGASTRLQVFTQTNSHIYQDFVVDGGMRSVTAAVRYQLLSAGVNAFRMDLVEVVGGVAGTRLGFFSDVGPGPTGWRVRSVTGRFDGLTGGVAGPRTLRVRLFPYNAQQLPPPAGQAALIDSVWIVDGEYCAPYRPNSDAVELLRADNRQSFFAGTTNVDVGPTAALPTQVPSNAVGMVVEMQIQGSAATTFQTILRVDDNEGASQVRDIHAIVNNRPTIVEYTVPVTPGGIAPQWSVLVGNPANTVTYAVRVKTWFLRM